MTDVLVIGSGAGGGPLALALSKAGMNVLVLEKGPRYSREEYVQDEMLSHSASGFFVPLVSEDPHVLIRGDGTTELTSLGWIASCVGGGTSHMGAALYRFHPLDFRLNSEFGKYLEVADWAYTYEDLEPFYSRAEWAIGVSGKSDPSPLEVRRSIPLPLPPLETNALAHSFDDACARMGLHPFPTPRAVNSRWYQGRPPCAYCAMCGGHGCPIGARGSTQETVLAAAERTGRCRIQPLAMVTEITVGNDGYVDGCIYIDRDGLERRARADIVCVCCSAVESARLLLLSRSRLFPDGLANGSGLIGRNLQLHAVSSGRARFRYDKPPLDTLRGNTRGYLIGRSLMDYYFLPNGVSDLNKGGLFRFDIMRPNPIAIAQRVARANPENYLWGNRLMKAIREHFTEGLEVEFEVFQDFLPNKETFIDLDPQVKDKWGLPAARIHLREPEHHRKAGDWLVRRGLELLSSLGAEKLVCSSIGETCSTMAHGTCRAGNNVNESVLNGSCQAHEVSNLFVVDGSFMPTSGGAPSTLTILANSFRTSDYIIDAARKGELRKSSTARRKAYCQ